MRTKPTGSLATFHTGLDFISAVRLRSRVAAGGRGENYENTSRYPDLLRPNFISAVRSDPYGWFGARRCFNMERGNGDTDVNIYFRQAAAPAQSRTVADRDPSPGLRAPTALTLEALEPMLVACFSSLSVGRIRIRNLPPA